MSEIPDGVMSTAVGVKTLLRFTPEDEWGAAIARAILAERKRCADVARGWDNVQDGGWIAGAIAEEIEAGQ